MKISKTKQKKNKIEFGDRQYNALRNHRTEYEPSYLDI